MISLFWQFIAKYPNQLFATLAGGAVLTLALLYPHWWGERSVYFLVGVAITFLSIALLIIVIDSTSLDTDVAVPWILLVIPVTIALIFRKFPGTAFSASRLDVPFVVSPQAILLTTVGVALLVLFSELARSVARGERVSIENHWGGLGGGIAGWRISGPVVYLMGIVFLLAVSSALAWRFFPPPGTDHSQRPEQVQPSSHDAALPPVSTPPSH